MPAMAHAAHSMAHTAHPMHALGTRMDRSKARAMIDTSCRTHSTAVATADISSAFPMNAAAFAVDGPRVLRMRGRLSGAVRIADEPAKVQTVIVRNFSPALARLVQRDDIVEALSSGVRQQVRFLQSTPTQSGRRPLRLQRFDRNSRRI